MYHANKVRDQQQFFHAPIETQDHPDNEITHQDQSASLIEDDLPQKRGSLACHGDKMNSHHITSHKSVGRPAEHGV